MGYSAQMSKMQAPTFALDRSARRFDADGRLHVGRSHISKATVNPYYGSEIPGYEALGLDANKVYQLFRDPAELQRAAPTFANLPILSKHVPVNADAPRQDLIVGSIGSNVTFDAPYLDADICIYDAKAIAGIESGKVRELSCAYRYVPVMEPGEYEGQRYDGRMTEIQGNHLALVEIGRAGSDVVVADHSPFIRKTAMKMSKLGRALFAVFGAASPKLAADQALAAVVGNVQKIDRRALAEKLIALDADLNPKAVEEVLEAMEAMEKTPRAMEPPKPAEDETPAEKVRAMLAGKVEDDVIEAIVAMCSAAATDESPAYGEEVVKKEEMVKAMDSLRAEMNQVNQARADVRPVVGDVIGMDSAAEIYGFALDHLGVKRDGVTDTAALKALFQFASSYKPAPAPTIAQDSAATASRFPGVRRFRNLGK